MHHQVVVVEARDDITGEMVELFNVDVFGNQNDKKAMAMAEERARKQRYYEIPLHFIAISCAKSNKMSYRDQKIEQIIDSVDDDE